MHDSYGQHSRVKGRRDCRTETQTVRAECVKCQSNQSGTYSLALALAAADAELPEAAALALALAVHCTAAHMRTSCDESAAC